MHPATKCHDCWGSYAYESEHSQMAPNLRTLAEWAGGPVEQARFAGPPQAHRQDKNGQTMGDRYGRHIQHV